jgi:hypothetical protein
MCIARLEMPLESSVVHVHVCSKDT